MVVPRRDRGGRAPPRSASSYMKKGSGGETAVVVPRRDRPRIAAWSTSGRRLCSPGLPVRRDGQLWLSIPLRCETSVQCSDSHYFYDGWQKDPQETVVGFHNTRLESLVEATPTWTGTPNGNGILVDGRLRYGCCTHNGCSGVNVYSDGGLETFDGSKGWVQLSIASPKTVSGWKGDRGIIIFIWHAVRGLATGRLQSVRHSGGSSQQGSFQSVRHSGGSHQPSSVRQRDGGHPHQPPWPPGSRRDTTARQFFI